MKHKFSKLNIENYDQEIMLKASKRRRLNGTETMNKFFQKKFNVSFNLKSIIDEYLCINPLDEFFCLYCEKSYLEKDTQECNICDKIICEKMCINKKKKPRKKRIKKSYYTLADKEPVYVPPEYSNYIYKILIDNRVDILNNIKYIIDNNTKIPNYNPRKKYD